MAMTPTLRRGGGAKAAGDLVPLVSLVLLPFFLQSMVKGDPPILCPPNDSLSLSCDIDDTSSDYAFIDTPDIAMHLPAAVLCISFCWYDNPTGAFYPWVQFVPDILNDANGPGTCSCYYKCKQGLKAQTGTQVGYVGDCGDASYANDDTMCTFSCATGVGGYDMFEPPSINGNNPSGNTPSPSACLVLCLTLNAQYYAWTASITDGTATYGGSSPNTPGAYVIKYGDCFCFNTDCFNRGDYEEAYPAVFVKGLASMSCWPNAIASLPASAAQPTITCDNGCSSNIAVQSSTKQSLSVPATKYTCTLKNPSTVFPINYYTLGCTNFQPYLTDTCISSLCQVLAYIPPGASKTFSYTNPAQSGPAIFTADAYPYPAYSLNVVNAFTALPVSVACKDLPAFNQRGVKAVLTFTCTLTNAGPSVTFVVFNTTIMPISVSGINQDFTFTAGLGSGKSKTFSFATTEGFYTLTLVYAGNQAPPL